MPPVTLASRPTIVPSMTMPESSSLFCTATVARTLSDPEYPGYAPTSATALRDVWYVLVGGFAGVFDAATKVMLARRITAYHLWRWR